MQATSKCAALSAAALRSGDLRDVLTDPNDGLGPTSDHAVVVRTAASTAIAFLGVRRASVVAQLLTSGGDVDLDNGLASVEVVHSW